MSLSLILSLICHYKFPPQIIFHKENPGIDYEFYVPVEKKDAERERPVEVEWETGRHQPRERSRERESGSRSSLRSKQSRFVIFLRLIVKASPRLRDPSLLEVLKKCQFEK